MKKRGVEAFLVLLCGLLMWWTAKSLTSDIELFSRYLYKNVVQDCTKLYCPVLLYKENGQTGIKRVIGDITQNTIFNMIPLYGYMVENIYTENDEEYIESSGPQEIYKVIKRHLPLIRFHRYFFKSITYYSSGINNHRYSNSYNRHSKAFFRQCIPVVSYT